MEMGKTHTIGCMNKPELPWHSRFDLLGITFLLFLAAALGALPSIEGSGRDLDYMGNLARFAAQFSPGLVDSRPYLVRSARNYSDCSGFHPARHPSFLCHFFGSIPKCFPSMVTLAHPHASQHHPHDTQPAVGPASCGYCWIQFSCWSNCPHPLQRWIPRKIL